ncbi:transglutaminase superfamily protein [Alicyclobacillus sacchari]|uniref:Transglutaminase superfamily protein n=1 Tax=Alicyclobacillus sacchari TaxID=392010 RepID=A0A4R8LTT0_9BACL|nr:transglutaminase domain-containing protein [Alicyclobacillus sacchari]TDY51129.1 transglutaminase superfamily protein [Alicyclobacillus sacchari]GMA56385.1 hypothetical protein GCM10025858_08880 [Alicyclobacillus sacchari]
MSVPHRTVAIALTAAVFVQPIASLFPTTVFGATLPSQVVAQAIAAQRTSFSVSLPMQQTEVLVQKSFQQQPYFAQLFSNVSYESDGTSTRVTIAWLQSAAQTRALDQSIRSVEHRLLQPGMSDYDKEWVIHNWIVQHVSYDTSLKRYTPYDAFQGSAVCQGIAALAYRMLSFAGIPVRFVDGTAGGGSHLWNEVEIRGHWYQLDVTWDDPIGGGNRPSYLYYNLTNAQMAATHTWNESSLPKATTDFAQVVRSISADSTDPILHAIANNSTVMAEFQEKVNTQTIGSAISRHIAHGDTQFTMEFAGSAEALAKAMAGLQLSGFQAMSYTYTPSRLPGYQAVQVTIEY